MNPPKGCVASAKVTKLEIPCMMMSGCFFSIRRHAIGKHNILFPFVLKSCHLLMISVLLLAWIIITSQSLIGQYVN